MSPPPKESRSVTTFWVDVEGLMKGWRAFVKNGVLV